MTDLPTLAPAPAFVDLRSRLRAGESLFGTFTGLASPVATELVARAGFDCGHDEFERQPDWLGHLASSFSV